MTSFDPCQLRSVGCEDAPILDIQAAIPAIENHQKVVVFSTPLIYWKWKWKVDLWGVRWFWLGIPQLLDVILRRSMVWSPNCLRNPWTVWVVTRAGAFSCERFDIGQTWASTTEMGSQHQLPAFLLRLCVFISAARSTVQPGIGALKRFFQAPWRKNIRNQRHRCAIVVFTEDIWIFFTQNARACFLSVFNETPPRSGPQQVFRGLKDFTVKPLTERSFPKAASWPTSGSVCPALPGIFCQTFERVEKVATLLRQGKMAEIFLPIGMEES